MKKLRKTAAMLCCFCLLAVFGSTSLPVSAAEQEYLLTEHTDKYKTQGRVLLTGECLLVDWTASGIEFEANCEGDVYVKFQVDAISSNEKQGCYFTVIVDGVTQPRTKCHLSETGESTVKIASGLPSGKHTFALYRQTEIRSGTTVGIRSILLSGELLPAPAKKDLYVEFVGDSITTAYGNLTTLGNGAGEALYQDGTKGYAYLTAQNLGADYSIVAIEGIGASTGWQSYTMQQVYPKLRYLKDRNTNYDFARQPDVVVLALGTNDINRYSANGKTLADVKQGFADMLSLVRTKNPESKVVWIYGMMIGGADTLIREVINEAGGETAGLYSLSLARDTSGGNGHPTVPTHKSNASTLSTYIHRLLTPATSTTVPTSTTTTAKKTTTTRTTTTTTKSTTKTTKSTTVTATTTATVTTKSTATAGTGTTSSVKTTSNGFKPLRPLPPLPDKTTESTSTTTVTANTAKTTTEQTVPVSTMAASTTMSEATVMTSQPTRDDETTTAPTDTATTATPVESTTTTAPMEPSTTMEITTTTKEATVTTAKQEEDTNNGESTVPIVVILVVGVAGVGATLIFVFRRKV